MIDNAIWFVAKDICCVLGLDNITNAIRRIPEKHKGVNQINTLGGVPKMSVVSEPGLYRLVLRSDKPQAEPFMEWITEEVLPAIRKTGSYTMPIRQEKLCPDKLNEIGFASRSALMVAKSMGNHSKVKKQKLVSDLVEEATGYNLQARLQDSGLIEIPVATAVEDSIQSYVDHALEERNQSQTIQIVYEGFVYYWKEVLGLTTTPPHTRALTKRLRQLGYELDKHGGVLRLVGYALSYDFKSEMAEM